MEQNQLIILLCTPRSGSTMLQRMIGSHSAIHTHPEPNLLLPLKYLGYFAKVDAAPYDHINAAAAQREFFEELPGKEEDVYKALRAYALSIYADVTKATGKTLFLDKTPEYGSEAPFLAKLFPQAKFVVLTRHPLAIWHSQAHSFFAGSYQDAHRGNPILEKYVPKLASFIKDAGVDHIHVRYEDLVAKPEAHMKKIAAYLKLDFEAAMVNYGQKNHISKSYGDPMNVQKHDRPVTSSTQKWAQDLSAKPAELNYVTKHLEALHDEDLRNFGYPRTTLLDGLEKDTAAKASHYAFNGYRLKRKVLMSLKKDIEHNAFGDAVRRVRYYCDVLLRT